MLLSVDFNPMYLIIHIISDMANISEVEDVLKELESCLSSHHYLILELKQNIIPVYKRNLYNDWSMIRIIQLCTDIISVLKIIQPGLSRLRGKYSIVKF